MPQVDAVAVGKVAFAAGATGGIGRATALAFGQQGANVVLADLAENGAQQILRAIEEAGGKALAVPCDVSKEEDVRAALDRTVEVFGGLDFAFNNAGGEQQRGRGREADNDPGGARCGCFLPDLTAPTSRAQRQASSNPSARLRQAISARSFWRSTSIGTVTPPRRNAQ